MGQAERARKRREKDAKAQAWAEGVPTVVTLAPEQFHAVRAAVLQQQLAEHVAAQRLAELRQATAAAMHAAGLDPARTYRLKPDTLEAELVG